MACATVALALVAPRESRAHERSALRTEFGVASPAGVLGVRASFTIAGNDTRLEPGVGMGLTGTIVSLIASTRIREVTLSDSPSVGGSLRIYAGYGVGIHSGQGGVFASRYLRQGSYHWLESGIAVEGEVGRLVLSTGAGLSILASQPRFPADGVSTEDLYPIFPEWWVRNGWAPHLWFGVGMRF